MSPYGLWGSKVVKESIGLCPASRWIGISDKCTIIINAISFSLHLRVKIHPSHLYDLILFCSICQIRSVYTYVFLFGTSRRELIPCDTVVYIVWLLYNPTDPFKILENVILDGTIDRRILRLYNCERVSREGAWKGIYPSLLIPP